MQTCRNRRGSAPSQTCSAAAAPGPSRYRTPVEDPVRGGSESQRGGSSAQTLTVESLPQHSSPTHSILPGATRSSNAQLTSPAAIPSPATSYTCTVHALYAGNTRHVSVPLHAISIDWNSVSQSITTYPNPVPTRTQPGSFASLRRITGHPSHPGSDRDHDRAAVPRSLPTEQQPPRRLRISHSSVRGLCGER